MGHDALVARLMAGDRTRAADGPHLSPEFLHDLVRFAARYTRLEKLLFGGPRVAYSSAALELDLSAAADVMLQAERLADAERERFRLAAGPILELGWLIEDQGVKIVPRRFPPGTAARGGFFFDSEMGPCILVDAETLHVQRDYVLAHQYGHFLADYDPYITTICGHPGPATLDDPRELRAHQFALSFLMPRRDMETYRQAFGLQPGSAIAADFVRQLQVYFAVDFEMVFWRLLSLAWIEPARIEVLLRENADLAKNVIVDRMDADERLGILGSLPERFVHLVASAFGRGLIELPDAATYLGIEVEEARHVLEQFRYEETADRDTEPPQPPKPPLVPGGLKQPGPNPN